MQDNDHVMDAKVHPPHPPTIEVTGTSGLGPAAAFHMDMTLHQARQLHHALGVALQEVGRWDNNVYN